jgi:hypothetical protein
MTEPAAPAAARTAILESDRLRLVIADNSGPGDAYAGFHGVVSLVHKSTGRELVVPGFSVLGVDSFTFDRRPPRDSVVGGREPRFRPTELTRPSADAVRLHQPATPWFGVETAIDYALAGPELIEVTARYRFHEPATFGSVFAASWPGRFALPEGVGAAGRWLHFPGHTGDDATPRWLRLSAASAEAPRCVADSDAPADDPGRAVRFFQGVPLCYGLLGGLAWTSMFLTPAATGLAYSPDGGVNEPALPAVGWGFFHRIPAVRGDREYTVRQAFSLRPFDSRADLLDEFARLSGATLSVAIRGT